MNNRIIVFLASIFFLFILILTIFWSQFSSYESTDNAYIRGSITNIASRIDGYVENVPGVLNTLVKKGDVLVNFDRAPYQAQYDMAMADLNSSKASIQEINALIKAEKLKIEEKKLNIKLAKTKINMAKEKKLSESSNLEYFSKEKDRMEKLLEKRTITKKTFEKSQSEYQNSLHKVEELNSDILAKRIKLEVINKEIKKIEINIEKLFAQKSGILAKKLSLESKLRSSLIDLESTIVISPVDGIIANRIVEPGVYMKKGWALMSVVPVEEVWVIANFKETQIKNIKEGQEVNVIVDAYSNKNIKGKVLSISPASASSFSLIPPQNASGNFVKVVQRLPVKISLFLPEELKGKIFPGMSVVAKVKTKD